MHAVLVSEQRQPSTYTVHNFYRLSVRQCHVPGGRASRRRILLSAAQQRSVAGIIINERACV